MAPASEPLWTAFFRSRSAAFVAHHDRLRTQPDPPSADRRFRERVRHARLLERMFLGSSVGFYFTAIAAVVGFAVAGPLPQLATALHAVGRVAATLSTVFLLGMILSRRALGVVEVELHFLSAESRGPVAP